MKKRFRIRDFQDCNFQISDNFDLPTESTRVMTPEGYLKATAAVTKVGVQMYSARDFGIDSDEPIGVLRPEETVFHPETMDSLKMKPIVLLHPEQDVDSTNHSRLSVGSVGEKVEALDSERLGASIQITDEAVVKKILEREIEELSLGYDVYIIAEEGNFNGINYLYKMDGPMLNNHLAIVPEGRCGDTVKILDQGGKTVNKKQMIKALRDAGVSEDAIKKFMAKKKDDDVAGKEEFEEYSKLLLTAKDIDISAIVPEIVAELKPALEEIVAGEEFKTALAKEIAATMVGAGKTPDGGDMEEEDEEEEVMTQEQMDAAIQDGAAAKVKLIDKAAPFIDDKDFDLFKAKDRDIIEKALKSVGLKDDYLKDKTDDYLLGVLDSISKDRKEAQKFMTKSHDNAGVALSAPMTGIRARKALA